MSRRMPKMVIRHPDPRLVRLLEARCDGGMGEYDEFVPKELAQRSADYDDTFEATLEQDGSVTWWWIY